MHTWVLDLGSLSYCDSLYQLQEHYKVDNHHPCALTALFVAQLTNSSHCTQDCHFCPPNKVIITVGYALALAWLHTDVAQVTPQCPLVWPCLGAGPL